MNTLTIGTYKDVKAIVLENDVITIKILPEWGSKIVSFFYKPLEYELLWQNPSKKYKKTKYGDPYESGEASGLDEMFPTISLCYSENFPWEGTEMPDHGELWSIPWDYETGDDYVRLWVHGIRFPYKLEKRVSIKGSSIHIDYSAVNLSDFEFDFIWAAHPLFCASEGMEIIVPPSMNKIINSVSGPRLKDYGKVYSFPVAQFQDGSELYLGYIPKKNNFGYQKYYFLGKVKEGWCILYDRKRKINLGMSYPVDKVPYLGMWVNEGSWEGQYNIAPEPATGGMDRVDAAKIWGMRSVLKGHEYYEWYLNISVREGEKACKIKENGEFVI